MVMVEEKQNLVSVLEQLAFSIKNEIEDSLSRGIIQPEEEVYLRWKIDKFQYTEKGVTESAAHGEYITKKSWFRSSIKIEKTIKKFNEYSSALKLLTIISGEDKADHYLEYFVKKLIFQCLYESSFNEADINTLITTFLKDLNEEPVKYGAKVELDGIVMQPERIDFRLSDVNIILRQTKIEDLEKEFPVYGYRQPYRRTPSAILDIEFLGRQANEIQMKVGQTVATLRLFRVGSVKDISYRMRSESIIDIMASGTLTAGESEQCLEQYPIKEEDTQRLKRFWQAMMKTLPRSFYDFGETKLDYVTIAYKRYCDALVQNGVLERRIANSVMGLESLFLKGGETQELIYRLSIRIAKMFGLLDYDSYKVKETIKDAYKIRSLFVHGGHLSHKEKRKLESEYGDIRTFLLLILDYLRISIIIMIFDKKEKDEFIDLIDASLIDSQKEGKLNNFLNTPREYCWEGIAKWNQ